MSKISRIYTWIPLPSTGDTYKDMTLIASIEIKDYILGIEKEIEQLKEQLAKAVEVIELTHYDIKNCGFISFMELRLESFLATTKE